MSIDARQKNKPRYLVGIDEVGRGPIAGPVAVGVFIFLLPVGVSSKNMFRGVRESKQLDESEREVWFEKVEIAKVTGYVDYCVTMVSEKVIDKKGISFAIKSALKKSLNAVVHRHEIDSEDCTVLLDGGLHAPADFVHQKTIIKGDVKEKVIALSSICAKVTRDRHMRVSAKKYPRYGFDIHKGYGTRKHYAAIKKYGLCKLHRRSFLRNLGNSG